MIRGKVRMFGAALTFLQCVFSKENFKGLCGGLSKIIKIVKKYHNCPKSYFCFNILQACVVVLQRWVEK